MRNVLDTLAWAVVAMVAWVVLDEIVPEFSKYDIHDAVGFVTLLALILLRVRVALQGER